MRRTNAQLDIFTRKESKVWMEKEQDLVNSCLEYLQIKGIPCWRQNQGAMRGTYKGRRWFVRFTSIKGISDILGVLPPAGRLLAVEAKVRPNKPSEDQERFITMVNAAGGLALVVYDLRELVTAIKEAA